MKLIIQNISKIISLTPEEESLFLSKIETKHFKAKTILLSSGEICKEGYFVNSGLLRSFNINDNIVEHVLSFACEGWWIGDMYSLLSQKRGNLFIEVLEDSEVEVLSKENQEKLPLFLRQIPPQQNIPVENGPEHVQTQKERNKKNKDPEPVENNLCDLLREISSDIIDKQREIFHQNHNSKHHKRRKFRASQKSANAVEAPH